MTYQEKSAKTDHATQIQRSLREVSVGSFLFQRVVIERLGLHPTDLHAIHLLGGATDGLTAGELGAALGLTSGSTTAVIERLRKKGYVTRTQDATDRRRVVVRLAPTATEDLHGQYRTVDERINAAISALSEDQRQIVARFLATLAGNQDPP